MDLAGSEKVSENMENCIRFTEGKFINLSLFEIGRVIDELSKQVKPSFVNYRTSKLTRILKHSLGGNAKTAIICTVSPVEREETKNTIG